MAVLMRLLWLGLNRSVVSCSFSTSHSQCGGAAIQVQVETQGPVRVIGINRPDHCNAVNQTTAGQLYQAFKEFDSDPALHAAVLHGLGGNFCAGYDLKELATTGQQFQLPHNVGGGASPMGPTHMVLSKPVIAAVSGYAVAGGLELALLCDLRVVETDAIMGVFSRRFGVPLIDGGTVRLPVLIGLSRALDLILTGRPIQAEEALNIGLANRVVPKHQSIKEAITLAEQLCKFPQECLRTDRISALKHALAGQGDVMKALAQEYSRGIKVVSSEAVVGARKFSKGKGRHGTFQDTNPK